MKPSSPALRFMSGLMGRMDRFLATVLGRALPEPELPPGFVKPKSFHKQPSYKGPKPPGQRDLHRVAVKGHHTQAWNRAWSLRLNYLKGVFHAQDQA